MKKLFSRRIPINCAQQLLFFRCQAAQTILFLVKWNFRLQILFQFRIEVHPPDAFLDQVGDIHFVLESLLAEITPDLELKFSAKKRENVQGDFSHLEHQAII